MKRLLVIVPILSLLVLAFVAPVRAEDPDPNVRSRLRLAESYAGEGRMEDALGIYRELHDAHPDNPRVTKGLKGCLLELKRYDELLGILQKEVALAPDDPATLEEYGTAAVRKGDRAAAAKAWLHILDVQQRSRGAFGLVTDLLTRNRLLDEAVDVYAQADSLYPGEFTRQKAALHELRFEFDAATKEYLKFLVDSPTALSWVEGRLLRIGENEHGLDAVIRRVEAAVRETEPAPAAGANPPRRFRSTDLVLRKLLADLALEAGRHEDARVQYFKLLDDDPGQLPSLLVFGKRCETDGAWDVAIKVFDRIVKDGKDARAVPGALSEIADCERALSRWDDALAAYARLISDYPETDYALDAKFQTGVILRDGRRKPVEAEAVFKELVTLPRGPWPEAEAQFQVAECALFEGDVVRARGIFTAIGAHDFSDATRERALYEEGLARFYAADFDSADGRFKEVAQKFPRGDHVNDALEMSILLNTNSGEPALLAEYAKAELALRTKRPTEAVTQLEALAAAHPDAKIADETLLLLGTARRRAGDPLHAIDALDQAVQHAQVPDLAASARLLKGEILAADLHDRDRALAEYEELLVAYPETLAADRARERVAKLTRALP
ncbi:MAG: tetratricopeptide repeat protein [bacterium]